MKIKNHSKKLIVHSMLIRMTFFCSALLLVLLAILVNIFLYVMWDGRYNEVVMKNLTDKQIELLYEQLEELSSDNEYIGLEDIPEESSSEGVRFENIIEESSSEDEIFENEQEEKLPTNAENIELEWSKDWRNRRFISLSYEIPNESGRQRMTITKLKYEDKTNPIESMILENGKHQSSPFSVALVVFDGVIIGAVIIITIILRKKFPSDSLANLP